MEEWPWAGVIFYWHFRTVHDESREQVMFYFRMADPDFTLHPVYFALKDIAHQEPRLYPGYHQEDHWALEYSGEWSARRADDAVLGGFMQTASRSARMSFAFDGSDLALVVPNGPELGAVTVRVDGSYRHANRLKRDAEGRATLELRASDQKWGVEVPVASGLTPGRHHVEIEVLPNRGPVAIDGLIVQERDDVARRLLGGLLLGSLALIVLWTRPFRG
jgi:hypothetical protein